MKLLAFVVLLVGSAASAIATADAGENDTLIIAYMVEEAKLDPKMMESLNLTKISEDEEKAENTQRLRRLQLPVFTLPTCPLDNCTTTGILTQSEDPFAKLNLISPCNFGKNTPKDKNPWVSTYWSRCFDLDGPDHQCTTDRLVENVTFIPTKAYNSAANPLVFSINIYTTENCIDGTFPSDTDLVASKDFVLIDSDYGFSKDFPIQALVPKDKVMWVEIAYAGTDGTLDYLWGPDANDKSQCDPWYIRCGTTYTTQTEFAWNDPMGFGGNTYNAFALSMSVQTRPAAAIQLDKTVKLGPKLLCDDETAIAGLEYIECPVCTEVTYCYKVTNTGGYKLCDIQVKDELHGYSETLGFCLEPGHSAYFDPLPSIIIDAIVDTTATAVGNPSFPDESDIPYLTYVEDKDGAEVRPSCCLEKINPIIPNFKQPSCLKPEMMSCPGWDECPDWMIKPKQCKYNVPKNDPMCTACNVPIEIEHPHDH